MNLVLARSCSNSCPYCFETTERNEDRQNLISMENVNKFASWANNAGVPYLSLLGGEPFLHPKLADIIRIFRQTSPAMELQIFTGGVFNKELLEKISPQDTGLIFNINEPSDYRNPKHFKKVISNLEMAIRKGFIVVLGFNVWREDFDIKFMPSLAHYYGRTNFRWTVANPQWNCPPNVIKPEKFDVVAQRCFAMLKEAARLDLTADLDCPLPLCFFNESQLAWIRQYHPGTSARIGRCEPVLDVTPELEVIRCFALSKLTRVKLTDFPNENAIWHWFFRKVDTQLLPQGCFKHCGDCQHFKLGKCSGGCLAWHECIVDMEMQSETSKLVMGMQQALEEGQPTLALELYDRSSYYLKTAIPKFAAAIAAYQLGKHEQAFRYAAYAQDLTTNPGLRSQIGDLLQKIPLPGYKKRSHIPSGNDYVEFISNQNI
ncbi:MAG: radical SAM protein [Dehalococcoidia bacterium]|nr:MAG: radical SAM protein [Dehalococcoidia bacterium]